MYPVKSFVVLVVAATTMVSATMGVDRPVAGGLFKRQEPDADGNDCGSYIGNCYLNGCQGVFPSPDDTIGKCTAGTYNSCPCNKCGSGVGIIGSCNNDGNNCNGDPGTKKCTTGYFQGCPCT